MKVAESSRSANEDKLHLIRKPSKDPPAYGWVRPSASLPTLGEATLRTRAPRAGKEARDLSSLTTFP